MILCLGLGGEEGEGEGGGRGGKENGWEYTTLCGISSIVILEILKYIQDLSSRILRKCFIFKSSEIGDLVR